MASTSRKKTEIVYIKDKNGNEVKAKQCFGPLCNGALKPLYSFHKNKNGLGGRKEKCIECVREIRGAKERPKNILIETNNEGLKIIKKSCTVCGEFKDLNNFNKSAKHSYGKSPSCKECESKRQREYYSKNKDKVKEKHHQYYQKNRDKVLQRTGNYRKEHREYYLLLQKNWRENNQERITEYNKEHYEKHKKHYKRVRRRYYLNNIEKFKLWRKRWRKDNPNLAKLYTQRYKAKANALPYNLSPEELDIINEHFNYSCPLTGETENLHYDHFICIDTGHMGTVFGNIVPMLGSLNISKHNNNPFEWIKSYPEYTEGFNKIVSYLAETLGLTIDEYKDFVYWCYNNKRTVKEIKNDPRTSLEIWTSNKSK